MAITSVKIAKRRRNKEPEPGIYGYITFKVTDHGKVVFRSKRQMHSLTALWFMMLWAGYAWFQATYVAYSPNSFVILSPATASGPGMGFWIVASSPYVGIVVGTGQNPENPQNYTLASPVTSSSSGLTYYPLTMPSPTVSGNTSTLTMSRTFINNGSSPITLTEVAVLVFMANNSTLPAVLDAALDYDYISPSITLTPEETLSITYQIQVTT